jgi:hypothetical protein
MKNLISTNKRNLLLLSLILTLSITSCLRDPKPPKANPYKEDKTIYHSLYREKDSKERMSAYAQSIPMPHKE